MNILYVTYVLNGLLMIGMPVGLAYYLTRKFKKGWRLFWIGGVTFLFSQLLHIPFNILVSPIFNWFGFIALPLSIQTLIRAIFLGLSAGLFEELSRYGMYRWLAREARSWGTGLLAGAGHGGMEAMLLGALVLYGYLQMVGLRTADLTKVVPAGQIDLARAQIAAYWSSPWYMTLLGAVERFFTIPLHLACSLLVLQAFIRRHFRWVALAILLHALADGMTVIASGMKLPALGIEALVGVFGVMSVGIIFSLRSPEPVEDLPLPRPEPVRDFTPGPVEETGENLDKTRYQ